MASQHSAPAFSYPILYSLSFARRDFLAARGYIGMTMLRKSSNNLFPAFIFVLFAEGMEVFARPALQATTRLVQVSTCPYFSERLANQNPQETRTPLPTFDDFI